MPELTSTLVAHPRGPRFTPTSGQDALLDESGGCFFMVVLLYLSNPTVDRVEGHVNLSTARGATSHYPQDTHAFIVGGLGDQFFSAIAF